MLNRSSDETNQKPKKTHVLRMEMKCLSKPFRSRDKIQVKAIVGIVKINAYGGI